MSKTTAPTSQFFDGSTTEKADFTFSAGLGFGRLVHRGGSGGNGAKLHGAGGECGLGSKIPVSLSLVFSGVDDAKG